MTFEEKCHHLKKRFDPACALIKERARAIIDHCDNSPALDAADKAELEAAYAQLDAAITAFCDLSKAKAGKGGVTISSTPDDKD